MKNSGKNSRPAERPGGLPAGIGACLLFLLFLLASCAPIQPRRGAEKPHGERADALKTTPASLQARAKIETGGSSGLRGRAVITVKSPDLVRIEVHGPMNSILAVIGGDSKSCFMYLEGMAAPCVWGATPFGGYVKPEELATILLDPHEMKGKNDWEVTTGEGGRIASLVKLKDGSAVFSVTLKDYREVEGVEVPFNIVIENGNNGKEKLEIEYYSIELNPEIDSGFFRAPGFPAE